MFKRKALVFAVVLALCGAAGQVFSDNDFDRLQIKAEAGDPDALLEIGRLYLTGRGVPQDVDRGVLYLRRAADRSNAYAYTELARYYEQFPKDPQAVAQMQRFYRRGAELGDTDAQTALGRMLIQASVANGFDPTYAKSLADEGLMLLRHAALNNNRDAAWELGYAMWQGRGLERNEGEGLRWLIKAADAGHLNAAYTVATISLKDPSASTYAPVNGRRYLELAANGGHLAATGEMAVLLEKGNNVTPIDLAAAETWAKRAVEVGVPDSRTLLARIQDERKAAIQRVQAQEQQLAQAKADAEAKARAAATLAQQAPAMDNTTLSTVAHALTAPAAPLPPPAAATSVTVAKAAPRAVEAPPPRWDAIPGEPQAPAYGGKAAASGELSLQEEPQEVAGTQGLLQQVGILRGRVVELEKENGTLRGQLADRDAMIATLTQERDRAVAEAKQVRARYDQVATELAKLKGLPSPVGAGLAPTAVASQSSDRAKAEQWNQQAMNELRAGDFKAARGLFERASRGGNAAATNNLATMYMQGKSVPVDIDRAISLYQQAADQGHGMAANNLGYIYQHGMGVPRDLNRARQWYVRAEALGVAVAGDNLRSLPREVAQQ